MKLFLLLSFVTGSLAAAAQPKLISQATVTTTTTVIAPEEDELQNVQNQGGPGGGMGQMFRNFGDGETKSTTYLKNDLVKTIIKTEMGRSTIIRNNSTKVTTTLMEMMDVKPVFTYPTKNRWRCAKKWIA
jgi:hypothetical protein